MINNIIINSFLIVVVIGILGFLAFIILKKLLSPNKSQALRNMIKTGNYKGAIKVAKEVLSKSPRDFEAHYFLGEAYYKEGKKELALIEYKSADKIGSYTKEINELNLRQKLAELYLEANNLDEALKEYALLLQKKPDDYLINFKMGELFEKKNQRQQALKYYMLSYKVRKNYPPTLLNLGVLLFEVKKYSEAETMLEKTLRYEPENSKCYFYLGMVFKNTNNHKKALKYFEQSVKDKTYKVRSLAERGMIYVLTNKLEDAVIELERALKYSEGESLNLILNMRYILASCHESLRNITEAIKQWEKIYSIKPDFKDVSEKLANYQDLRMDDRMKDYMTATNDEFIDICKKIIAYLGDKETSMNFISNDGIEFMTVDADNKWRNVKKKPKIFHIYRKSEPIDEKGLRKLHETMKKHEIVKAIVITSSSFSNQAALFAQERPIKLVEKSELQTILNNISF